MYGDQGRAASAERNGENSVGFIDVKFMLSYVLLSLAVIAIVWAAAKIMFWMERHPAARQRREWEAHTKAAMRLANDALFPQEFGFEPNTGTAPQHDVDDALAPERRLVHMAAVPTAMTKGELEQWARDQWKILVASFNEQQRKDSDPK